MSELSKKVVWITGASSGIGEALVYELARKGARLILSARRKEMLDQVKGNCPASAQLNIRILPLDLTEASTLKFYTGVAIQFFGHVDILINNAGIGQRSLVKDTVIDIDRKLMEVNYFAAISLTKNILPHFLKRKAGHYVIVSSLTGKFGTPYRSGYAASKHALHGFFDAVRAEHYNDNITITVVCPGFIDTPLDNAALIGNNLPARKTDKKKYGRKSPKWCAKKIVKAIEKQKQEVYLGGIEVLVVHIKRFFPLLFSYIIRKVAVR